MRCIALVLVASLWACATHANDVKIEMGNAEAKSQPAKDDPASPPANDPNYPSHPAGDSQRYLTRHKLKLKSHHETHEKERRLPTHAEVDEMYPRTIYRDVENPRLVHTVHEYDHHIGHMPDTLHPENPEGRLLWIRKRMHTVHDTARYAMHTLRSQSEVRFYDNERAEDPDIERYLISNPGEAFSQMMVDHYLKPAPGAASSVIVHALHQIDRKANFFMREILSAEPVRRSDLRRRTHSLNLHTHRAHGRFALAPGSTVLADATNCSLWLVRTRKVSYHDIFQDANMDYVTNYLPQYDINDSPGDVELGTAMTNALGDESHLTDYEETWSNEDDDDAKTPAGQQHRGMKQQFFKKLFRKIGNAFKRVGKAIARGIKKVASGIARGLKKVGGAIFKGLKAIGKAVWNGIKKVVTTVVKIVVTIVKALLGIIDVNERFVLLESRYNLNNDLTFNEDNYNNGILIIRAGYFWQLEFRLKIDVKKYKLRQVRATIYGAAGAGAELKVQSGKVDFEWSKLVKTIKLKTIRFFIGPVPVFIRMSLPITVKFTGSIEVTFDWNAKIAAMGEAELGLNYQGGMKWVNERKFVFEKKIDPFPKEVEVTVTATPGIDVTLVANINYIGGPTVTLGVGIQNVFSFSTISPDCRFSYTCAIIIEALLGAQIEINIEGIKIWGPKTFGPWSIFRIEKTIVNLCLGPKNKPAVELPAPAPETPSTPSGSGSAAAGSSPAAAGSDGTGGDELSIHRMHALAVTPTAHQAHRMHSLSTAFTSLTESDIGKTYEGELVLNGTMTDQCHDLPEREYTVQILDIDTDAGTVDVIIMFSQGMDEQFEMKQLKYRMTFDAVPGAAADVTFTRIADSEVDFNDTTQKPPYADGEGPDFDPGEFDNDDGIETEAGADTDPVTEETTEYEDNSEETTPEPEVDTDAPEKILTFPDVIRGKISPGRRQIVLYDLDGCGNYLLRTNETSASLDSGEVPVRASAPPLVVRWSRTNNRTVSTDGSGAVADKTCVYTSAAECLNPLDGKLVWASEAVTSTIVRPVLLTTTIIYTPLSGGVFALRKTDGTTAWKLECPPPVSIERDAPRPIINATLDRAFVNCGAEAVALRLSDGQTSWKVALSGTARITSLSISGGATLASTTVFAGDDSGTFTAIAAATGSVTFNTTLPGMATTAVISPETANGLFYVFGNETLWAVDSTTGNVASTITFGAYANYLRRVKGGFFVTAGDAVAYFNYTTASRSGQNASWVNGLDTLVTYAPVVSTQGSWVAFAETNGRVYLYSFTADGADPALEWDFESTGKITGPLFRRGVHLVVTAEESVIGLSLADGYPDWRYSTGVPGVTITSVGSTADGIVVTTSNGETHAVFLPVSSSTAANSFFQFDVNFGQRTLVDSVFKTDTLIISSPTSLFSLEASSGQENWRENPSEYDTQFTSCVAEYQHEDRNWMIVGLANGNLTAYRLSDGAQPAYASNDKKNYIAPSFGADACATSNDGKAVVVAGSGGVSLVEHDGTEKWKQEMATCGAKLYKPIVGDDFIIVSGLKCLTALSPEGEVLWEPDFDDEDAPLRLSFAPLLLKELETPTLMITSSNVISAVDPLTGETYAQMATASKITSSPLWVWNSEEQTGVLIATTKSGTITAFSPDEDEPLWVTPVGATPLKVAYATVASGADIIVAITNSTVIGILAADGTLLWTYTPPKGGKVLDVAATNPAQVTIATQFETLLMDVARGVEFARIFDDSILQVQPMTSAVYLMGDNGVAAYPRRYFPRLPSIALPDGVTTAAPAEKGTTAFALALKGDFSSFANTRRQSSNNARKNMEKSIKADVAKLLGVPPERVNVTSITFTNGQVSANFTIIGVVDTAAAEKKAENGTTWLGSTRQSMVKYGDSPNSLSVADVSASVNRTGAGSGSVVISSVTPSPTVAPIDSNNIGAIAGIAFGSSVIVVVGVAMALYVFHQSAVSRNAAASKPMMADEDKEMAARNEPAAAAPATAAPAPTPAPPASEPAKQQQQAEPAATQSAASANAAFPESAAV